MNEIIHVIELALEVCPPFIAAGMGLTIGWRIGGAVSTIVTHWRPRIENTGRPWFRQWKFVWRARLVTERWPYWSRWPR